MTLEEFIRDNCSTLPADATLEPVEAGEGGDATFAVVESGKPTPTYFVKGTSDDTAALEYEKMVKSEVDAVEGIPVADLADACFPEDGEYGFFMSEALPSEYIQWSDPNAVITLLYEVATTLSALHSHSFEAFQERVQADYSDKYKEDFTDWRLNRYIRTMDRNPDFEDDIPELRAVQQWLNDNHTVDPVLIHGDMHLPNVLTDADGHVLGFIDWGSASFGDHAYDLAKFESRVIDLYAQDTQFSREMLVGLFRELYGYDDALRDRVDAHKHAYGVQFRETLAEYEAFEDWEEADVEGSCRDRYEELLPTYREESPVPWPGEK